MLISKGIEHLKIEALAHYAHLTWSGWIKYMFSKATKQSDGTLIIPAWAVERWSRQAETDYHLLSEQEKDSDRDEARKIIEILTKSSLFQMID